MLDPDTIMYEAKTTPRTEVEGAVGRYIFRGNNDLTDESGQYSSSFSLDMAPRSTGVVRVDLKVRVRSKGVLLPLMPTDATQLWEQQVRDALLPWIGSITQVIAREFDNHSKCHHVGITLSIVSDYHWGAVVNFEQMPDCILYPLYVLLLIGGKYTLDLTLNLPPQKLT
jgi:hypothetical protein